MAEAQKGCCQPWKKLIAYFPSAEVVVIINIDIWRKLKLSAVGAANRRELLTLKARIKQSVSQFLVGLAAIKHMNTASFSCRRWTPRDALHHVHSVIHKEGRSML